LGNTAVVGDEGDQVHPVEFVVEAATGVPGGVVDDPEQQRGQQAQPHVGADAVLAVVEDRPQPRRSAPFMSR